jgi:hypothetical protein
MSTCPWDLYRSNVNNSVGNATFYSYQMSANFNLYFIFASNSLRSYGITCSLCNCLKCTLLRTEFAYQTIERMAWIVKGVMQFIRIDLRKLQIFGFRRLGRLAFGFNYLGLARTQDSGGPARGFKRQAGNELLYACGIRSRRPTIRRFPARSRRARAVDRG